MSMLDSWHGETVGVRTMAGYYYEGKVIGVDDWFIRLRQRPNGPYVTISTVGAVIEKHDQPAASGPDVIDADEPGTTPVGEDGGELMGRHRWRGVHR